MTTDTTRRTFLGIEVHGDINEGDRRRPQRPIEELRPIIQAILDDTEIVEFGWRQYTPYFNDGDPCIFRVEASWVRLTTDDEDKGYYDLTIEDRDDLGDRAYDWRTETYGPYSGPDEARYDRCRELDRAIQGGEFIDVLLATFGDHADITVRRDGIQVDTYDHD